MNDRDAILNQTANVRVGQVRSYLLDKGWVLKASSREDTIRFQGPLDDAGEPLIWSFPSREDFTDYSRCVERLLNALQVIEKRRPEQILKEMLARPTEDTSITFAS